MTQIKKNTILRANIIVLAVAVLVAFLQANPVTSVAAGAPIQPQVAMLILVGVLSISAAIWQISRKKTDSEGLILWSIWFGMLMRAGYVLFHDIHTLQNDDGTYTGFGTEMINNGHIGYIEYIYKFFHLPDMNPYDHFGYYHPPLHHIIEAIWMTVQRLLGVDEALAFENLQVPTLIYSGLCMVVMLCILLESGIKKDYLPLGLALFAFHPRMMVLGGSVNNDILALLLLLATIWRTLVWIRNKTFGNIILIALSLGFGMISKLNTAICAFSIALIFLMHFISVIRSGDKKAVGNAFLQYVVFGVISIPIGLSYIVRNLVLFGEKPGIPSPALIPNESIMYTGEYSVWSIIGIPSIAELHAEFPFHPLSAAAIHNTWVILFQTGLFAEGYPMGISNSLLAFAQIAYVASIIAGILATIVFITGYLKKLFGEIREKKPVLRTTFLTFTYIFMLLSFCLYVFKYPYTCSSDFRYMTASLVFTSLGIVYACDEIKGKVGAALKYILCTSLAATIVGSLIVYLFWGI